MQHSNPSGVHGSSVKQPHARWPLFALAVGAFGIGTTEFSPMGMLPTIAHGVDVSIPSAGILISAYAIGVMVGAPIMTLLLAKWPRRNALMLLMAIFTLGNILSAIAPDYFSLMLARIVTSLNHGAFFGIGSVVAASLVPREKQASAVAFMFLGLTIANIGGVPLASWLGETVGWRESFAGISILGLIAIGSIGFALPKGNPGQAPDVLAELKVLTHPIVLQALLTTVLSSGAMFALYTYINPSLQTFTHASAGFVTAMLVLVGVGFSIGNTLGGKLADHSINKTLGGFLLLLALSLLAFPWIANTHIGAALGVLIWATAAFAVVPPIQMRVMRAAAEAPSLASSINIGAFNLGNALGAALGAATLQAGWGYTAVMLAGGALALAALTLVVWSALRH